MSVMHGSIDLRGAVANPTTTLRAMGGGTISAAGAMLFADDWPPARGEAGRIHAAPLWNLFMLHVWHKNWMRRQTAPAAAARAN